jgi:tetratricopeptide (TPR) repeat protein
MNRFIILRALCVLVAAGTSFGPADACIQDSFSGTSRRLDGTAGDLLAEAARGRFAPGLSLRTVKARLQELLSARDESNPYWWVNVSGAYLRLGEAAKAAGLLEGVVHKFKEEYAIHSNLGTAYHLLGRYSEAEHEIRTGLLINPEAHDGLEYYHLALLQYLSRDAEYKSRHLYVDEWTEAFFGIEHSPTLTFSPRGTLLLTGQRPYRSQDRAGDDPPAYRYIVDLGHGPKFLEGLVYMASLNQKEPAVFVMLGVAALDSRDGSAARDAFVRAIELGAPNKQALERIVAHIDALGADALRSDATDEAGVWLPFILALGGLLLVGWLVHWYRQNIS